jgi:DNA-directed RNA polymerase I, II, and III subunit RPABC2
MIYKQINSGSLPFIDIKDQIIDGYLIAEMELNEKKIPFIVRRPLPNGASEYWKLQELEIL